MNYPRVAVLLAAYNGASYIVDQLHSILNQKSVEVVVFVSIDLSSDGTEDLIFSEFSFNQRIIILSTGLRFGGAARNFYHLISEVDFENFDYVSFADQDDIWHQNKLNRACDVLAVKTSAGYSSNVMAFWSDGKTCLIDKAQPQRQWDFLFEAAGPGCTYVLRQDLAYALQGFVRSHWVDLQSVALHDWFTYAFARSQGFKWIIDPEIGMDYRQHSSNQVGVNAGLKAFKYRFIKVLQGWGTAQAGMIASILGLDGAVFVRRWKSGGRLGMLWLAFNASQCRRRIRDRIFFALSCVALAVLGRNQKL